MTEEQIKQNAEGYYDKLDSITIEVENEPNSIVDAYIAGAHSRDEEVKHIEEKYVFCRKKMIKFNNELNKLRNQWISVHERLPEEHQDVLIENWNGLVIRNDYISIGDINYMKDNPELFSRWMLTPKPGLN